MPTIHLAHSPDSDDAFMFYALAKGKIATEDVEFVHVLKDIQTLNEWAKNGKYEVTALSFHAYALLADRYALLPHGASMGEGYGPVIVSHKPMTEAEAKKTVIASPGGLTTAHLLLKIWHPEVETRVMAFDKILPAVLAGEVAAGLLIHEGQLTYADEGAHKVVDFGEWWGAREPGLPLPLGGNGIRKDLGPDRMRQVSRLLKTSIEYGLSDRERGLDHAATFARGLDRKLMDRFVGMYVNQRTVDYGPAGRTAVQRLLDLGAERGLIPAVQAEFID
jgi:1,4-dihydroxy-6-naphthoate synthase